MRIVLIVAFVAAALCCQSAEASECPMAGAAGWVESIETRVSPPVVAFIDAAKQRHWASLRSDEFRLPLGEYVTVDASTCRLWRVAPPTSKIAAH